MGVETFEHSELKFKNVRMLKFHIRLCTNMYTGDTIPVMGVVNVTVNHNNQTKQLPLLIVKGEGPTLLGKDWLTQLTLNIDWSSVNHVQV